MPRNWQFTTHDTGLVAALAGQLRCSTLLAQVLLSRGLGEPQQARSFLKTNLNELQEPELLPGMTQAVDAVVAAIQDGRKITIYGDYDVDGMTSTALLLQCFQSLGVNADYYIPCRMEEGYGLNCEAIRELHQTDPERLVITVDCGVSSLAEAELARELGLRLIITDHHRFGEELPCAVAVVHPRIDPDSLAFPDLCGAGVAFKLAWAICKRMGDGQRASERMREFLKSAVGLAMIGTVADVVPLVGENRLLVKYGLGTLVQQAGPGLKALMLVAGVQEKSTITAEDIGFGLAPRLNAAGRLGQARLAVELLVTRDPARAAQLAEYLDGLNKQRQTVERKIQKQARELVEQHPEWLDQKILVLSHAEWHPGVIGIVASRIAEQFEKPALMITLATNNGQGQGSGRSYAGFDLYQAVSRAAEHLLRFGGHPAALGFKIEPGAIEAFWRALNVPPGILEAADAVSAGEDAGEDRANAAAEFSDDIEELPPRLIDSEVALSELSVRSIEELDSLGPFGCQNERPLFVATGVELAEAPRTIGEGGRHLSLQVKQYGQVLRAVAFGRGEWAEQIAAVQGPLALCFRPNINEFRGRRNVELQLIDWKSHQDVFQDRTSHRETQRQTSRTA